MSHDSCQRSPLHRRIRLFTRIALPLAAAALLAPAGALAAAAFDGDSGFSAGTPRTASGRPATLHLTPRAQTGAAGMQALAMPPITPLDGTTGIFMEGAISASWGGGQADIKVAAVVNQRASGTSGDLTLHLIATTAPPVAAVGFSYFDLASVDLGTLDAGFEFDGIDTGEIAFTPPPTGCYYMSLLVLEDGNFGDVRTFSTGGTLTNTGFALFGFGQACPAATFCTRTATGACLLSARFQVAVSYTNQSTGSGAGTVLNFGAARAESDESVFYYFTDPSNFELGIKILDACALSNTFWVFIGGLTNQGWGVHILDTATGTTKNYGNPFGTTTVTTTDTAALPCP
jgi:hypothetical protein